EIYHRAFGKKSADEKKDKFKLSLPNLFKKKAAPVAKTQDETPVKTLQGGIVMTIDDCVNYALKNDPSIKIYEDTQKAQKSLIGQAKSNYFPSIFAGTGYNINNTQYSRGMDSSVNNNFYGIDAGVSQLIWDFGKTAAKINMNKYNYEAAGYDLAFQIAISAYNVRFNYTAVLAARANEGIYGLNVRIQQLNYERTKAMYEVGLKSKIDVVNAQANLTKARIDLLQAQNTYQTALIALNNSMYYVDAPEYLIKDTETFNFQNGYSIKNEIDVAYDRKHYDDGSVNTQLKDGAILTTQIEKRDIIKTYKLKPYTMSLPESIQKAYEHRPDYMSAKLVVKAQQESLKAIKRSYYPALNASAQYNMGARNDYTSNAIGVYGGIDFPNVNAMNIKYQIDQGKALLSRAENNTDLIKKNIYFAVQRDYVTMKQYEKTIPLKSQRVAQALENFELADGRYAVGLGNYIELQQALTDYNNAQLDFVSAVFNYNYARFTLGKDMGIFEGV
ncbi:MAG: TolC family protein, partial [Bacillota bacterium]|nr:TolC family protein [Bacillota bacterium]